MIVTGFVACQAFVGAQPGRAPQIVDPLTSTRSGKLTNGLTYFIAPGEDPKAKIVIRLIIRAGEFDGIKTAAQLAHIVEHVKMENMRDVVTRSDLLARAARWGGVRGVNLNANAGPKETSYFLEIPANNGIALEDGLDFLNYWVSSEVLNDEDVDRARKTVAEELRAMPTSARDQLVQQLTTWFPSMPELARSAMAARASETPIEAIKEFHRTFYQPENMAIVVVGPVDPDRMVKVINERFGYLSSDAESRVVLKASMSPAGHYVPLIQSVDTEPTVRITYKYPAASGSREMARASAVRLIADKLFADAIANWDRDEGAAIRQAYVSSNFPMSSPEITRTEIFSASASVLSGRYSEALAQLVSLFETVRLDGFSDADFDRVRADVAAQFEEPVVDNLDLSRRFQQEFVSGEPSPGAGEIRSALAELSTIEFNSIVRSWLDPANRDVFVFAPDGQAAYVPAAKTVAHIINAAEPLPRVRLSPPDYQDPKLGALPHPVKIDIATRNSEGVAEAVLPKSGARFIYRQVATDRFTLRYMRVGDMRGIASGNDLGAAIDLIRLSGLGGVDRLDLQNFFEREQLSLSVDARDDWRGLQASGPADKLPLILQVVRSYVKTPQCSERVWEAGAGQRPWVADNEAVRQQFEAVVARQLNGATISASPVPARSPSALCRLFKQEVGDPRGITIVAEGPIASELAMAQVAAALDRQSRGPFSTPPQTSSVRGTGGQSHVISLGVGDSASVLFVIRHSVDAADRSGNAGVIAGQILNARLVERLREKEKAVYYVGAGASRRYGPDRIEVLLGFDCLPENIDRLASAAEEEVQRLAIDGASTEEIANARLVMPTADTFDAFAERALFRGDFSRDSSPSDAEVNQWLKTHLQVRTMDRFVRLPEKGR